MSKREMTILVYGRGSKLRCEKCGQEHAAGYLGKLCVGCGRKINGRRWPTDEEAAACE